MSVVVFFASCAKTRYTWSTEDEYYRLPMWKNHVRNFKKIKMAPNTAKIFIGDSITEGFDLKRHLDDSTLVNMGIGGDFTSGVLRRLDVAADLKPAKVFVMIGINDILKDVDQARIENNYREIISYLKNNFTESKIYIQSVLPTVSMGGSDEANAKYGQRIQQINQFLKDQCADVEFTFIDLYPEFEISAMKLNPEYTYDGLHLSDKGYTIWSELVRPMLK